MLVSNVRELRVVSCDKKDLIVFAPGSAQATNINSIRLTSGKRTKKISKTGVPQSTNPAQMAAAQPAPGPVITSSTSLGATPTSPLIPYVTLPMLGTGTSQPLTFVPGLSRSHQLNSGVVTGPLPQYAPGPFYPTPSTAWPGSSQQQLGSGPGTTSTMPYTFATSQPFSTQLTQECPLGSGPAQQTDSGFATVSSSSMNGFQDKSAPTNGLVPINPAQLGSNSFQLGSGPCRPQHQATGQALPQAFTSEFKHRPSPLVDSGALWQVQPTSIQQQLDFGSETAQQLSFGANAYSSDLNQFDSGVGSGTLRAYHREIFCLSQKLADFVGSPVASMLECVKAVMRHINKNKLRDPANLSCFIPDQTLRSVLGSGKALITDLPNLLRPHLSSLK